MLATAVRCRQSPNPKKVPDFEKIVMDVRCVLLYNK